MRQSQGEAMSMRHSISELSLQGRGSIFFLFREVGSLKMRINPRWDKPFILTPAEAATSACLPCCPMRLAHLGVVFPESGRSSVRLTVPVLKRQSSPPVESAHSNKPKRFFDAATPI